MWSSTHSFRRTVFGIATTRTSMEFGDEEEAEEEPTQTAASDVERRWKEASFELQLKDGPKLLLYFTGLMLVFRILDKYGLMVSSMFSGKSHHIVDNHHHLGVALVELLFYLLNIAGFCLMNHTKHGAVTAPWRVRLYYILVVLWSLYVLLLGKYPLSFKCCEKLTLTRNETGTFKKILKTIGWNFEDLQDERLEGIEEQKECNSLHTNTIIQVIIVWILGVTPQLFNSKSGLKWQSGIFFIFYATLCWYEPRIWENDNSQCNNWPVNVEIRNSPENPFQYPSRQCWQFSLVWIFLAIALAINKKKFLDKGQRTKFVSDLKEREACEKIFNILEFMVPLHVIAPMLANPGAVIAKQYNRASILFIMFTDFDQHARSYTPEELLHFLNRYFTEFDNLCMWYDVTKIETVAEEYVCAVGVGPADKEIDENVGHGEILGRLVKVALHILKLQSSGSSEISPVEEGSEARREVSPRVEFKLGIHTGPIVAGVIGQKLPRFRLFGDTINTAARMMQKGLPGELQFGEETKENLPDWVRYRERGIIEMKGKGQVKTFLLERRTDRLSRRRLHVTFRDTPDDDDEDEPGDVCKNVSDSMRKSLMNGSADASNRRSLALKDLNSDTTESGMEEPQVHIELPELAAPRRDSRPRGASSLKYQPAKTALLSSPSSYPSRGRCGTGATTFEDVDLRSSLYGTIPRSRCTTQSTTTFNMSRRPAGQAEQKRQLFHKVMQDLSNSTEGGMAESRQNMKGFFTAICGWTQYELEDGFQKWFHENTMCKKLDRRLERYEMYLLFLTAFECFEFELQPQVTGGKHWYGEEHRLLFYVICRLICILMLGWVRSTVANSGWYLTAVAAMQRIWLGLVAVTAILIFSSYDALSIKPADVNATNKEKTMPVSTLPVRFFIIFVCIVNNAPFLFMYSLFIVFVGVLLIVLLEFDVYKDIFLTFRVKYVLIVFLLLNSRLDFTKEKNLRARYKAQRRMDFTRERINHILNTLMPPLVVQDRSEMATNADPPSHHYYRATIAQSDLVGFTKLASTRQPREVVEFIGELFGAFDALTDKYGIYKVETVGDAYIAGQAEEPLTFKNSPLSVVLFGLEMVKATREWAKKRGESVNSRVGVHFGECIGGIVGTEMQRYHLFGELMSQLEVLESTAGEGRVQVSQACKEALDLELRVEGIPSSFMALEARADTRLVTSKGENHDYTEVGGQTYLVRSYSQFLGFIGA